jgi:hypothetical protein
MAIRSRYAVGQKVSFTPEQYGEALFEILGIEEGPDGAFYRIRIVESSHPGFRTGEKDLIPVGNVYLEK